MYNTYVFTVDRQQEQSVKCRAAESLHSAGNPSAALKGIQTQPLQLRHLRQSLVFPEEELSLLLSIQDFTEG